MLNIKEYKNYDLEKEEILEKLDILYEGNGVYQRQRLNHSFTEKIRPLRDVVNRSVEFYVSKLSTSMTVSSQNPRITDAINQILVWSNFSAIKPSMVRKLSLYGNLFLKIVGGPDKVYFEVVDNHYITMFNLDSRGYINEIRIDIPLVEDGQNLIYTEYWNKTESYYSTWKHQLGINASLDQLGTPVSSAFLEELGIDFVPFVQIKFKDIGKPFGNGSVFHALDKIDEANREATRLSDMLFRYNKPLTAVSANNVDKNGRPIPAPKLEKNSSGKNEDLFSEEDTVIYLPGTSTINSLVPQVNYADALSILNAQMEEIENDLPELKYYSIKDSLSGKAIKLLLAGAIDRATEAQNNFLQGLIRVNQIALTLGSYWNLFSVGSYEAGDFDHEIIVPEMFPTSNDEQASILKDLVAAGLPLSSALRLNGFSDDQISTILKEKAEQDSQSQNQLANSLMQFNQG
jgi:hypothetical protein